MFDAPPMISSQVTPEIRDFFLSNGSFIVLGHQEPDGDCIGSQLAMAGLLRRLGKKVLLVNQGPFKKEEVNRFQPLFQPRVAPMDKIDAPVVIVLDCSTLDRVGEPAADVAGLKTLVIDHHTAGAPFGDLKIIIPTAPSTSLLVQGLFPAFGVKPDAETAQHLLLGLCTDTGFFRHCEAGSGAAFHAAAELVDAGASVKAAFAQVNGGKPLGNFKLMGLILGRTEAHFDGRAHFSYEYLADRSSLQAENRESDLLYQCLQAIKGNEVICLIREESPGFCTVGLRSKNLVDVGKIAQKFQGGGHVRAAGFSSSLPLRELKARLLDEMKSFFA